KRALRLRSGRAAHRSQGLNSSPQYLHRKSGSHGGTESTELLKFEFPVDANLGSPITLHVRARFHNLLKSCSHNVCRWDERFAEKLGATSRSGELAFSTCVRTLPSLRQGSQAGTSGQHYA